MYDIFKRLCERSGVTPYRVSKETGIATATLSDWKNGKYALKADKIEKLAEYFGVTPDYIYGKTHDVSCPICYQTYDPLNPYQDKDHTCFHNAFVNAIEKYGELLPSGDASDLRERAIRDFRNPSLSMEERKASYANYLRYDYMTKVYSSRFSFHLSFEDYCKEETKKLVPDYLISLQLCNEIRNSYGVDEIDPSEIDIIRDTNTDDNNAICRIPVVRRVAAGIPLDSIEEIIAWEEMPSYKVKDDKYFGLKIQGNSMEPGIADGDIVLVREQPDAEDGQIVVAIVNGNNGCCKRLKKYDDGKIALMSDNPAYAPMYFDCTEVENTPVSIRGVVKELRRSF